MNHDVTGTEDGAGGRRQRALVDVRRDPGQDRQVQRRIEGAGKVLPDAAGGRGGVPAQLHRVPKYDHYQVLK